MQITVENFLGCKSAAVDVSGITIIGGKNEAGKTSFTLAAAAALSDITIPFKEVSKKESQELVNDDARRGSVFIRTEAGTVDVSYPGAEKNTAGIPPEASSYAVGLAKISALPSKERADALAQYIKALPTKEDLEKAVKLNDKETDLLWNKVSTVGWEKAHEDAKAKGQQIKGQWQQVAGTSFKPKDGIKWLPSDWEHDLNEASEDKLVEAAKVAREALEKAIKTEAVSLSKVNELQEKACGSDLANEHLEKCKMGVDVATKRFEAAKEARDRAFQSGVIQHCPDCNTGLIVDRSGKIQKAPEQTTPADLKKVTADANAAEEILKAAQSLFFKAQQAVKECQDANEQIKKLAIDATPTEVDVPGFRAKCTAAEGRLTAFRRKAEADRIFAQFVINQELIAILAPDGLRQKCLTAALGTFNAKLSELTTRAGWKPVVVKNDLSITHGGRPFYRVSTGAKRCVDIVFQVAMAEINGDQLIIVDEAGVWDKDHKKGLLKLLKNVVPAIIIITCNSPEQLPPLPNTYWMEGGVCTLVERKPAAVA